MHNPVIDQITLPFLLQLRRAKTLSTLEIMTTKLERDHALASDQEAISAACVIREKEIRCSKISG